MQMKSGGWRFKPTTSPPPKPIDAGLATLLPDSDRSVLPIRAVDLLASLLLRRDNRISQITGTLVIALVPALSVLAATLINSAGPSTLQWTAALSYSVVIFLALWHARRTWQELQGIGAQIDDLLGAHAEGIAKRLAIALRMRYQFLVVAFGGIASFVAALLLQHATRGHTHLDAAYVVTISWTGAVGAVIVYWIWAAPLILLWASRTKDVHVDPLAPLQTPGIRHTRWLMQAAAWRSAWGLMFFVAPIALTLFLDPTDYLVLALAGAALGFSLLTVCFIAFAPQRFLNAAARHGRDHALDELRSALPSVEELMAEASEAVLAKVALYDRVASAPVTELDWRRFVEWSIQILTATMPFIASILALFLTR